MTTTVTPIHQRFPQADYTTIVEQQPQPNPLLDAGNLLGAATLILAVIGIFAYITRWLDKRRKDDMEANQRDNKTMREAHDADHRLLEKDLASMVHKSNGHDTKLQALELQDSAKERRIQAVEMSISNIEKSLADTTATIHSIQASIETVRQSGDQHFQMLAESLREIRDVRLREDDARGRKRRRF
jgi:hypothetical protein